MLSASEALTRLRDGNSRFAADESTSHVEHAARRQAATQGQSPFAVILGCSDSRVPAEIVFDQSVGDLFVIRVAGNIATPSLIGSVEYAVANFGTRLVVVLGHSRCGAVKATLEQLQETGEHRSPNLQTIVESVRPSIEALLDDAVGDDPDALIEQAVRANVHAAAQQLRDRSEIIEELERDDGLLIVGAEYSLDTGLVDFFDGVPESS